MTETDFNLREQASEWRLRLDEGLTPDERSLFEAWLADAPVHREAFAEAELFWAIAGQPDFYSKLRPVLDSHMSALEVPAPPPPHEAEWDKPSVSLVSGVLGRLAVASMALAASVAVFLAVGGWESLTSPAEAPVQRFATQPGGIKTINLPDGSRVTLGASSSISLSLSKEARRVELSKGAAFFDVVKNKERPFLVTNDLGEITVTGTRFDVQIRTGEMVVAVAEGGVRVAEPTSSQRAESAAVVDLSAMQAIALRRSGGFGDIYEVFPAEIGAWRAGRLVYVRKPLGLIVEDLNRYTERPLSIDSEVQALEISGTYDARDMDALLQALEDALPVRVIDSGEGWRIAAQ